MLKVLSLGGPEATTEPDLRLGTFKAYLEQLDASFVVEEGSNISDI